MLLFRAFDVWGHRSAHSTAAELPDSVGQRCEPTKQGSNQFLDVTFGVKEDMFRDTGVRITTKMQRSATVLSVLQTNYIGGNANLGFCRHKTDQQPYNGKQLGFVSF